MDISKVVVFRAGNEEYGVPIENVISIEKLEDINVIPNMPYYMKGVVMVRGELIPTLIRTISYISRKRLLQKT